jgi:uncharacterized membrane protein YdjX (TVP38/TMEM64 family)
MTGRRQPDQAGKKWPGWWPWAAGGFLLLVLCLGWFLLPLREWIEALQSWLLGLGLRGVMIFVLILIVVTFLPAPDWPLPIAAGYVYGFWAFPLTCASIAFASVLAFFAARYLLRDKIQPPWRQRLSDISLALQPASRVQIITTFTIFVIQHGRGQPPRPPACQSGVL